jgi:hypothetical protein
MATFTFNYDVRYYNGCITVDADNLDEARTKFDHIHTTTLLDGTTDSTVSVESIALPDGTIVEVDE